MASYPKRDVVEFTDLFVDFQTETSGLIGRDRYVESFEMPSARIANYQSTPCRKEHPSRLESKTAAKPCTGLIMVSQLLAPKKKAMAGVVAQLRQINVEIAPNCIKQQATAKAASSLSEKPCSKTSFTEKTSGKVDRGRLVVIIACLMKEDMFAFCTGK